MPKDDTTFRPAWDREPTDPWVSSYDIIRRIMAARVPRDLETHPELLQPLQA